LNSLRETYNVTVYADDLMEDKRKRKWRGARPL
jgi:hypothetical protein